MHPSALVMTSILASAHGFFLSSLFARQSNNTEEAYLQSVCFPNTTDPVPPCQEIINIEAACQPNGTSALYLQAHAQCMCGGSFFSDWIGCLDCNYVHGARSEQNVDAFHSIITSASHELCTGTPTASFAAIFESLNGGVQGTGATAMSDQFPSSTAIGLYFTPSGAQGVGAITGSATAATATALVTGQVTIGSGVTSGATTKATSSQVSAATGSSSSTSTGGAASTGVVMGMLGVVGGVVMAAL